MTAVPAGSPVAAAPSANAAASSASLFPAMLMVGMALAMLANSQTLLAVWQANRFFDSDDAMQLVQLRDWLGGQSWFDELQRRMDPPFGVAMHWSHVAEVPMAILVRFFGLFVEPGTAERLMRITYPLLFLAGLAAAGVAIARQLLGPQGRAAAILLALVSLTSLTQFAPGRITHNAAQVVLMMLMVSTTLRSFSVRNSVWPAALSGGLAAVSLAISLEDLPFIATMATIYTVAWVLRGDAATRGLAWFGGSFALSAAMAYLCVVSPARSTQPACDAFSAAHLIAAVVGGAGVMALAGAAARIRAARGRAIGAAAVGAATVLAVALTFPVCLGDPYSAVDPVVRQAWMGSVLEAQPMFKLLLREPLDQLAVVAPVLLGFAATAFAARATTGDERARWIAMLAFAGVGIATGVWQVRTASYAAVLTVFGAGWLFSRLIAATERAPKWALVPALSLLPFIPSVWALASILKPAQAVTSMRLVASPASAASPSDCLASPALAALNTLPPGLIMSTIDPGPFMLALTHHSVVTGPYHRDNRGLRLTIDALSGDLATARDTIRSTRANYFAFCPEAVESDAYAKQAPHGLIAALRQEQVLPWLRRVEVPGTPYRVYRIER